MLSPDQEAIIDGVISSGSHARIRGRAGTGKTYTLRNLIAELKNRGKRTMVLTPTGAAACRLEDFINGQPIYAQTIHRALGLQRPQKWADNNWPNLGEFYLKCALSNKKVLERLRSCEVLLIDECSMLGQRMFETMNKIFTEARGRPGEFFGGVQVIFCGDFLQLPPVKDGWLFDSRYYRAMNPTVHSLTKIMRTSQPEYTDFQNYIRARNVPVFGHPAAQRRKSSIAEIPDDALLLVHTNAEVDKHNIVMAHRLFSGTDFREFPCIDQDGERMDVKLCVGMKVMALANHPALDYANSSMGHVTGWDQDETGRTVAVVKFDEGGEVPVKWKDLEWETQEGKLRSMTYYPLKPAYAATINKIQGITADNVAVQCSNRADHGRLFVALTRCRTLEGMFLILPDDAAMAYSAAVSDGEF